MKGEITQWFDNKGFGFIYCHDMPFEVFAHVSRFRRGYRRPRVGDKVKFQIEWDNGKANASTIVLLNVYPLRKRISIRTTLSIIVIFITMTLIYQFFKNQLSTSFSHTQPSYQQQIYRAPTPQRIDVPLACRRKTHCSQMTSYEEAVFFLQHCPNAKIDGDNDGIPCERQFGRYAG
ncbi:cold-shock protein (plasmid) [Aliivibrio wodanis]|uniref:Cold-shock protein n=1 Tax=Aliivibrio wodanis TaxID=80852 RepID=A0A090K2K7_9GAMM|nr:cold-shock protein [Aliivibrio wodanis]